MPLFVGPDPSADPVADPDSIIHPIDGGDLFVPDQLAWMVDFDRAAAAGMALRIPISAEQAARRLRSLAGDRDSARHGRWIRPAILDELLDHHRPDGPGWDWSPRGRRPTTPPGAGTGYTAADDPDASFDDRRNAPVHADH